MCKQQQQTVGFSVKLHPEVYRLMCLWGPRCCFLTVKFCGFTCPVVKLCYITVYLILIVYKKTHKFPVVGESNIENSTPTSLQAQPCLWNIVLLAGLSLCYKQPYLNWATQSSPPIPGTACPHLQLVLPSSACVSLRPPKQAQGPLCLCLVIHASLRSGERSADSRAASGLRRGEGRRGGGRGGEACRRWGSAAHPQLGHQSRSVACRCTF